MLAADLREHFPGRARATVSGIVESLPDGFKHIGVCGKVEQLLIGLRVLHDSRGLAVYREHHGTLAFLDVAKKSRRPAPERRKRLDVLGKVQHSSSRIE